VVDYFITCHSFDRAKVEVLVLLYVFFYPPFASIAKGEVFGLLHVSGGSRGEAEGAAAPPIAQCNFL